MYDILKIAMEVVFFLCLKNNNGGGRSCELRLHWHVQNASSAITT